MAAKLEARGVSYITESRVPVHRKPGEQSLIAVPIRYPFPTAQRLVAVGK